MAFLLLMLKKRKNEKYKSAEERICKLWWTDEWKVEEDISCINCREGQESLEILSSNVY